MRSLIVLLLVAAAALALFFTYNALGNKDAKGNTDPAPTAVVEQQAEEQADVATPESAGPKHQQVPISTRVDVEPEEVLGSAYNNSLTGRVITNDNKPVANALVSLSVEAMMGEAVAMDFFMGADSGPKKAPVPPERVKTDADGRYLFRGIEPSSTYYLVGQHPDYSSTQESAVSVGASGEFVGPDIVLDLGSILTGGVTDTAGNPIPGANVHLDSAYMLGEQIESPDRMSTVTNSQGTFEIKNISAGPRNISVSAEGHGTQILHNVMVRGASNDRVEKNFQLEIGYPIAGHVVGPDGAGIEGATVMAMNYGNSSSSRGGAATDENGYFIINDLRRGSYILIVRATGFRPDRLNRVNAEDMDVRLEMQEQASVSGCVVDSEDGTPVTGIQVAIQRVSAAGNAYESTGVTGTADASGCFNMRGLDPGHFVVRVEAPGFAPGLSEPFDVRGSEPVSGVTVSLDKGGMIRGTIVDSAGKPVKGARVSSHDSFYIEDNLSGMFGSLLATSATQRSTRSDDSGAFQLSLLTPGEYTLRVTSPAHTREYVKSIQVNRNKATDVNKVTLRSGGTVRGTVIDRAGNPLPRGFVHLRGAQDPNNSYDTRSGGDGSYIFTNVRPGNYKLSSTSAAPNASGDPFDAISEQSNSEVTISVTDSGTISRDLNLGG